MIPVSFIIVAKNEADVIGACLDSIQGMSDDIILCDTGSTDDTIKIAAEKGARIIEMEWQGYGKTKNKVNTFAKYDWILQLDADEYIDEELRNQLRTINWSDTGNAYCIRRKRFFMGKVLRYGAWGNEKKIRLFPRISAEWTDDLVHETLILKNLKTRNIRGYIYDQTFKNDVHFSKKMESYALLCAKKYHLKKVSGAVWKRFLSPIYTFYWNYFIRLGMLDGRAGLIHATIIAQYTFRKYAELYNLEKKR